MREGKLTAFEQFLDSWLAYRTRQGDIPGLSVSVLRGDAFLFSRAYGFANAEFGVPLTSKHLFSIASQTKMFTAAAVLLLHQEGKLRITDPAATYLPWLAGRSNAHAAQVTIEQLLNHSSGLAHDPANAAFWDFTAPFPTTGELRSITLAARLSPQPGGAPKYSNLGYSLLGEIIARASGQSYAAFIRQRLIDPLQLSATYVDYAARRAHRMPNGYTISHNRSRETIAARGSTRAMTPSVGLYATTDDMCRFLALLLSNASPLTADSRALACDTRARIAAGLDAGVTFGLGFRIRQFGGSDLIGHDGHLAGHVSAAFYHVASGTTVAVAANAQNAPIMQMSNGIFRALQWFENGQAISAHKRYSTRLRSRMSSVEVVTNGSQIVAVDPDSWDPFARPESLRPDATNVLRVTTPGSLANSGEIITYRFADDVVEAVNFTGISMVPEANYYGREITSATPAMSRHWLSLRELQYATLKAGRVIRAEPRRGTYHCRLLVDYGGDIGTRYAFLKTLPHGVPVTALRHKSVLGAVFDVWQFQRVTKEVLVLGLALDPRSGTPFSPDGLLTLEPDPTVPRTVWASDADEQIRQFFNQTKTEAFKFQALPEYEQDECDSAYTDSFHAWKTGNTARSKALLRKQRTGLWRRSRVRHLIITDTAPTPYQQWSIEVAKTVAVPQGGIVYTLPRSCLAGLAVPTGDFTIWDNARVTLNGYNDSRWIHTTIHDGSRGEDLSSFLQLKKKLLERIQQQGTQIR